MAANRINITLGDMQLIQVDILADLHNMNRSEYISSLINKEYGLEELSGNVDYKTLHKLCDERFEKKLTEKK